METQPSTKKKSDPFHVSEWGFFSGGAFFMSMFVLVFVFFLQLAPHNSANSGCLFRPDPKTDISTDNRDNMIMGKSDL